MHLRLALSHAVCAGVRYSLGITKGGTVIAIGTNENDRCKVNDWKDMISVAGYGYYTIGLTTNGKVVTTNGNDILYQLDTFSWEHIIDVDAGEQFVVGLDSNGKVYAQGTMEMVKLRLKNG